MSHFKHISIILKKSIWARNLSQGWRFTGTSLKFSSIILLQLKLYFIWFQGSKLWGTTMSTFLNRFKEIFLTELALSILINNTIDLTVCMIDHRFHCLTCSFSKPIVIVFFCLTRTLNFISISHTTPWWLYYGFVAFDWDPLFIIRNRITFGIGSFVCSCIPVIKVQLANFKPIGVRMTAIEMGYYIKAGILVISTIEAMLSLWSLGTIFETKSI